MPSGSYNQVYVKCPFYIWDDPGEKKIACEPIQEEEFPSVRRFRRKEAMDQCLKGYCCESYQYCEHYRMLMDYKYSDLEEGE